MKIAFFGAKKYDRASFDAANPDGAHEILFLEPRLTPATARLAEGNQAVCVFVNDILDAEVIAALSSAGVKLIALRCAGFNQVDLAAAAARNIPVVRVPGYSPYAVAEHALAMILALNRKIHKAYQRTREGNFSLEGLLGFDLRGRTVGVVGTGKIGVAFTRLLTGFGCKILAYDVMPNAEAAALGAKYVALPELLAASDIISLHCPLTPETHHLVNEAAISKMKPGVMLINTGRGALVDTKAIIGGLKRGQIGYLGLDVYEEEADLFFEDRSTTVIEDDVLSRLLTFPNVLVTGHQAFFTAEALDAIAKTSLANISAFERGEPLVNQVAAPPGK